jgi:hypothetical protein
MGAWNFPQPGLWEMWRTAAREGIPTFSEQERSRKGQYGHSIQ